MIYDCYKTPPENTLFDFREAWNDYRGADGYSIFGNRDYTEYMTAEVEEMVGDWRSDGFDMEKVAAELTERHGEEFACTTLKGCCQGEWQGIVYPKRLKDDLGFIEQEYFNLCDEWKCVKEDGDDEFYCFTYPLNMESDEEQLKNICGCNEVAIHLPLRAWVWS